MWRCNFMKIVINPKNMVPNNSWQEFRKVRAIIENNNGDFAISIEGGKCIFPGGKCEDGEDLGTAIRRELLEELGISFEDSDLEPVLELETIYDDFFDYRSQSIRPRHTITTYFYGKTSEEINSECLNLTDSEVELGFESFFVSKDELIKLLTDDHSNLENGKFFDEENLMVAEKFLK